MTERSLKELFEEFYQDIKNPQWPSLEELRASPHKPVEIVNEIIATFRAPDEYHTLDTLPLIAQQLGLSQIGTDLANADFEMHNYFFWSTVDFYRAKPWVLDKLDRFYPKPKSFDVLLGRRKHHRDLIYHAVDHEKNIVTYFDHDQCQSLTQCSESTFIWPKDIVSTNYSITDTADIVYVDDTIVSLSQIIPVDIYNQTAFTLVCESQCENQFSFFTEKVIKPMLAKRIFLVCSGYHYLHNLKKLGFKTFDELVDESYDHTWDLESRIKKITKEMERLSNLDQHDLYVRAQPILEHNHQLLMSTDWLGTMTSKLNQLLLNKLSID